MKATRLFILATLTCISTAFAVDPPPDGGYANQNTAEGEEALFSLTTGTLNTAIGFHALHANTTGAANTGVGYNALVNNTLGLGNTATGAEALSANTGGRDNSAFGDAALLRNTNGDFNTAIGWSALQENTNGELNVAIGALAMWNSDSTGNVGVGYTALQSIHDNINTAVGHQALRILNTGRSNVALGESAGLNLFNGSDNIYIANLGLTTESGTVRIGRPGRQSAVYFAGIVSSPIGSASPVAVGADGRLGVKSSSARYKEAIKPMGRASEAILSLEPVTFRYKKSVDPSAAPQFGLVAEEVEKVDPNLVAHDASGKPFTVRYEEVNAMLLNEFLKAHRKLGAQGEEIAELKAMLRQQAAQLRKVNDRLEAIPPAPHLVAGE